MTRPSVTKLPEGLHLTREEIENVINFLQLKINASEINGKGNCHLSFMVGGRDRGGLKYQNVTTHFTFCIETSLNFILLLYSIYFKFSFMGKFLQSYTFVPTTSTSLEKLTLLDDLNHQPGPQPSTRLGQQLRLRTVLRTSLLSWTLLDDLNVGLRLNCKFEAS